CQYCQPDSDSVAPSVCPGRCTTVSEAQPLAVAGAPRGTGGDRASRSSFSCAPLSDGSRPGFAGAPSVLTAEGDANRPLSSATATSAAETAPADSGGVLRPGAEPSADGCLARRRRLTSVSTSSRPWP